MELRAKIKDLSVNLEKEKQSYQEQLAEIRRQNPQYDRHYKIIQRENELEKLMYGIDCKLEVLRILSTH